MTTPKPKLRWFQYSLRTLLVFVTLCAIPCSWLAVKMQQAKRQREAAAAIKKLGGCVWYDYQVVDDPDCPDLDKGPPPGPTWLRRLLGDDFFATVVGAQMLRFHTEATDADLKHIRQLPQLKVLGIDGPKITDAGLENLKGLNQLQYLTLNSTSVTDAGLETLKELNQLRLLDLGYTKVTDAGVEKLTGHQLQRLSIVGTRVTKAGLKKLQQALPNCGIDRDSRIDRDN